MTQLRLGDTAPDFEQKASTGTIRFHEYLGDSWGVLFSHPADFTPVCTTELGYTAKLADDFAKRNVKVLALSVDGVDSHNKWIDDINDTQSTKLYRPFALHCILKRLISSNLSGFKNRRGLVAKGRCIGKTSCQYGY